MRWRNWSRASIRRGSRRWCRGTAAGARRSTRTERERILGEARRPPEQERDGTATWSLGDLAASLRRALRRAPDGLPQVSTYTIWCVLREAGWSWQRTRTWCPTGAALRQRQHWCPTGTALRKAGAARPGSRPRRRGEKRLIEHAYRGARGWRWRARMKPGRSRPVPDRALSRRELGAVRRIPAQAAARVRAQRHGEAADALPSRDGRGAGQRRDRVAPTWSCMAGSSAQ